MRNIDNRFLSAYRHENLAVVIIKNDVFELITSLSESQVLMDFLREAAHNNQVKGVLFLNQSECLGETSYEQFIRGIMKPEKSKDLDNPEFIQKNTRFRQISILNRFIHFLSEYHKLVFVGIDCNIVTPFIGVTLVADIRMASPKAVFSLAHNQYGLHPSGAIPFFFTHYLGHSKSVEIQLSEKVTAEEAFRLGLVSQILPADHFLENCIRYVKPYLEHCRSTLQMTKRLGNFRQRWLEEYFEHETSLMNL